MLAEVHEQLGQHGEAAQGVVSAIKIQSSNQWLWKKLEALRETAGDTEGAAEAESKATMVSGSYSKQYCAY